MITSLLALLVLSISIVSAQTPKGTFDSKTLSISNMSAIRQEDSIYAQSWDILGMVKNIGNQSYDNIELVADIYNPSNQLIDVIKGSPSFATLAPGEQSSFKIEFQTDNKDATFDHYIIHTGTESNQLGQLLGLLGNKTK